MGGFANCEDPLPAPTAPLPIDGKSGTPSEAGLTEENSGVYRKYFMVHFFRR